jgi:hypothetical protein
MMPCCGGKRVQYHLEGQIDRDEEETAPVYFQYTGRTGMTVIGRETRTRYRFDSPGMVIAVNARDMYAISWVPNLRRVEMEGQS